MPMMIENFQRCMTLLLESEGGYVHDPKDPGGCTNMGVTKKMWEYFSKSEVSEEDMKNLTLNNVVPFYKELFWDAVKGDLLPTGIDYCVFDCAVNSGAYRSIKILQSVVGVQADGMMGDKTLAAVNSANRLNVIEDFNNKRIEFLSVLPTFNHFGRGWTARVNAVEDQSKGMSSA